MSIHFGHVQEPGVLIKSELDSDAKHGRNLVLAVWVVATVIFFPFGLPHLCDEICRELMIREIGRKCPTMGYDKCVNLSICGLGDGVMHDGILVYNPVNLDSTKHRLRIKIVKMSREISMIALIVIGIVGAIIIGI